MRKTINCFLPYGESVSTEKTIATLKASTAVNQIYLLSTHPDTTLPLPEGCHILPVKNLTGSETMRAIAAKADTMFTLLYTKTTPLELSYKALERMSDFISNEYAGMSYSDHYEWRNGEKKKHPVIDCQEGSVRDDFDFGSVLLFRTQCFLTGVHALKNEAYTYAALYAIRLFISRTAHLIHIPEYLYTEIEHDARLSGEKQFDYVNPRNREVQIEMEQAFTNHLKRIKAYLPESSLPIDLQEETFAYQASVIIPVRNRVQTIDDAIHSAIHQETNFPFNIIVVDNHSTDGTSDIITRYGDQVICIQPQRTDLGIGGCWDMAINHPLCGRFAVQLDSDDLYSSPHTLQTIVDAFYKEQCAMVIGTYRMTDFKLNTIAPGIIDHKEWTPDNGHNNALRINGLGAPRAFFTPLLRKIGVPNVSYGEDYALGLAISRKYKIGRIYNELYLCRRWEGNSDAALSIEQTNANNYYKDSLRTLEINQRKEIGKRTSNNEETSCIKSFIEQQLSQWELARKNSEALQHLQTQTFYIGEMPLMIQYNAARIVSSAAPTDAESIRKRPCFLCRENQPREQKRLETDTDFDLCVNPYPILPNHLTLPHRKHSEQLLPPISTYDALCKSFHDIDPDYVYFYNGARCGASAPDHFHFQAVPIGEVPLIAHAHELIRESELLSSESTTIATYRRLYLNKSYLCPLFIIADGNGHDGAPYWDSLMTLLPLKEGEKEPAVNLFTWVEQTQRGKTHFTLIIPRSKHRPACYFAADDTQMLISPGALDMAGIVVTPRLEDFNRITLEQVKAVMAEVGITAEEADQIAEFLRR